MIKTLKSFDLKDKNILIRADFNVPINNQVVTNNFRIKSSLSTIKTCLDSGASITLMSHLGRPNGKRCDDLSLVPVGEELASLLEMPIKFSDDCISTDSIDTSISLKAGEIHLLENLRFHPGEESNDYEFSSRLSRHGQIFINDAFGTAHRSHSSNIGVVPYFKNAGIGWLMDKEINYLTQLIRKPNKPLTLVLGGAKIGTKLKLIENFLNIANNIIIGGGMAFTFLKALGKDVGGSLVDDAMISTAKNIMSKARAEGVRIVLPVDVMCSQSLDNIEEEGPFFIEHIGDKLMGLDIGPKSVERFKRILDKSETILWNGPMGVFEKEEFEYGTKEIAKYLAICAENDNSIIIGGGDTAAAVEYFGLIKDMTHVSTGGGASLELLCGKILPALSILEI
tara:strand:- start:581 stop:1768 length:1188 start_codon:yes stop_codon:yes gene_type:complete